MEEKLIEQKVLNILWNKFQFHADKLTGEQRSESLLNSHMGFKAVDLLVLYMELEKEFDIHFDESDIVDSRFDIYDNIIQSIKKKLS